MRDCAQSHLEAILKPEAAGKRFICVNDSFWFKDLVLPVAERFGPEGWPVPTEIQERPADFDDNIKKMDNGPLSQILGIKFHTPAQTMVDMAAKLIELGAVSKPE